VQPKAAGRKLGLAGRSERGACAGLQEAVMTVGRVCSREIVQCRGRETLATVARLMMEHHVGSVVVVDDHGGEVFPVGMLTDRDIVRAALRQNATLDRLTAADATSPDPLVVRAEDDLAEAIEQMLGRGVRRAPVLDAAGRLVGVVAVDDLIGYLAEQAAKLARLVERQPQRERP
jgi:CBS domain-containing protein